MAQSSTAFSGPSCGPGLEADALLSIGAMPLAVPACQIPCEQLWCTVAAQLIGSTVLQLTFPVAFFPALCPRSICIICCLQLRLTIGQDLS